MSIIGTVSTVKYCQIRRESDLTARLKEFFNDFCLFSEASEAFPEIFPDNSIRIISNYFELFPKLFPKPARIFSCVDKRVDALYDTRLIVVICNPVPP